MNIEVDIKDDISGHIELFHIKKNNYLKIARLMECLLIENVIDVSIHGSAISDIPNDF